MRQYIKTNVLNLDKLLDSGIPEGSQLILAGGPGAGKTLFSFEILYRLAKEGKKALFFSFEEGRESILENVKSTFTEFTDIDKLIKDKKIVLYGPGERRPYSQTTSKISAFKEMVAEINVVVQREKINFVVIDSLSVPKLLIEDAFEYRNISLSLLYILKKHAITSIMTMEVEKPSKESFTFTPEFFMFDGIILLYTSGHFETKITRALQIIKMRGTKHELDSMPYEITEGGINIISFN